MPLTHKEKLIDTYFSIQNKYREQYGPKTILLMEVGSFYELYAVNDTDYDALRQVACLANIRVTRKNNKSGEAVSMGNPYMAGVTSIALSKYIKVFVEGGYNVVQVDQVTPPPNPTREVVKVHSPGTYEAEGEYSIAGENYLLSLYIEAYPCDSQDKQVYSIAGTLFDLTTGQTFTFECHDSPSPNSIEALSESYRIIYGYGPVETLVHTHNLKIDTDTLIHRLGLKRDTVHLFDEPDSQWFEISYQDEFLQRHFSPPGSVQPADHLGLSNHPHSLMSFILGLKFSYDHDKEIVQHLLRPKILCTDSDLTVSYHTLETLDVVNRGSSGKYSSLFGILNHCITAPGRRLLRSRLLSPTADIAELNSRYDLLEEVGPMAIQGNLKLCYDLQRLHRRLSLGRLSLYEFTNLHQTYNNLHTILQQLSDKPISRFILFGDKSDSNRLNEFTDFRRAYQSVLNLDRVVNYGQVTEVTDSIFQPGVYSEVDVLEDSIQNTYNQFGLFRAILCSITSEGYSPQQDKDSLVKLEQNDKEGIFFKQTKTRAKQLRKNLGNGAIMGKHVQLHSTDKLPQVTTLCSQLKFKDRTSDTHISSAWIENQSNRITTDRAKLRTLTHHKFTQLQKDWYQEHQYLMDWLAESLAKIDLAWSSYTVAQKRNYCRPQLHTGNSSGIEAQDLRHPITEVVRSEIVFVPNPVKIGKTREDTHTEDKTGVVITGLNGVGKSIYIKSVALAVLMAQTGLYVAASDCHLAPYTRLFTRIGNCDNLFRGQSTFYCEMLELESILRNSDQKSLVIADELCSGSEQASAQAILAGTILKLSQLKSNFFLTTHMHRPLELSEITSLSNLVLQHFKVTYDSQSGEIIYDRNLTDGVGPKLYGVEVAKHIIADTKFIDNCFQLRKQFIGERIEEDVHHSKYNSSVIVEKCEICGKQPSYKGELHTHHISEQADADSNGFIEHIPKNIKGNLVVLCNQHHHMVHHGGLTIHGWKQSASKGRYLSYTMTQTEDNLQPTTVHTDANIPVKKKKYSEQQVQEVRQVYESVHEKVRQAKHLLETKYGYSKISEATIRKMTKGLY